MSFKRVGDNPTALRVQKKQRVSELLLEDIPEDEATLIKNGRFACLVCKHCPVFDTVAVLSIHRQGKKHLANAKIRLERLREDAEIRQKREHMKYLETLSNEKIEEETPLLAITQEKKELALQGSSGILTNKGMVRERKAKNQPFFQSRKPISLNFKEASTSSIHRTDSNGSNAKDDPDNRVTCSKNDSKMNNSNNTRKKCSQSHSELSNSVSSSHVQPNVMSASERERREHNSRLRQAGWIMGLDGKWYKDENVEFDSDEDEPPPPP